MTMDSKKILSIISAASTILGIVAQLGSNFADSKKQDIKIQNAVAKEMAKQQAIPMKKRGS